eukprot:3077284-Rhodomonas_salina.4
MPIPRASVPEMTCECLSVLNIDWRPCVSTGHPSRIGARRSIGQPVRAAETSRMLFCRSTHYSSSTREVSTRHCIASA